MNRKILAAAAGMAAAGMALGAAQDGTLWGWNKKWADPASWHGGKIAGDGGVANVEVPEQQESAHSTWLAPVNASDVKLGGFNFNGVGLGVKQTEGATGGIQYVGENPWIWHTFMRSPAEGDGAEWQEDRANNNNYCYRTLNYYLPIRGEGANRMSLEGRGEVLIHEPMQDFGEVEIRNVLMSTNNAAGGFAFTDCDTELSGCVFWWPKKSGGADCKASVAKGKKFTAEAGAEITLRNGDENRTATLELGTIERGLRGTLLIADHSGTIGERERVKADGGVSAGLQEPWMVGRNHERKIHLMAYDAETGFRAAWPTRTNDLANAGESDTVLLTANATLTADKKIRGLAVENDAVLTIASGATLTVGDEEGRGAAVILNVKKTGDYTILAGGGAIDFGRSPGYVWMSVDGKSNYTRIDVKFKGTAGVTLAGGSGTVDDARYPYVWRNSNFNFAGWTGGTTLVNLFLEMTSAGNSGAAVTGNLFEGCGDLYVLGGDAKGSATYSVGMHWTETVGNRTWLSGMGNQSRKQDGMLQEGAFCIWEHAANAAPSKPVTFTNRVTLANDVAMSSLSGLHYAGYRFNCPVDGKGDLRLTQRGAWTYFAATNSCRGRTIVKGSGVLGIRDCGTFGDGPVETEGDLQFLYNEGQYAATNRIECAGDVELANADVKLTGKVRVKGTLRNYGESKLELGEDASFGTVEAGPGLKLEGAALKLTGDGDSHLANTIGSGAKVVKGGRGTLTVHKADAGRGEACGGTFEIDGGTMKLEGDLFKSPGLKYWMDASDEGTLEKDPETGNVMKWNSKNGNGYYFAAPGYTVDVRTPYYNLQHPGKGAKTGVNTVNGKNVLTFETDGWNYLTGSRATSQRTVVMVIKPRVTKASQCLFGTMADYSFRTDNDAGKWRVSKQRTNYASAGGIWLNGQWTTTGDHQNGEVQLLTITHPEDVVDTDWPAKTNVKHKGRDWEVMQLGFQYSDIRSGAGYNGDVAEMLAFDTVLTERERKTVENYLAKKWGISGKLHEDAEGNGGEVLGAGAKVKLGCGGTFDLNGRNQTVAELTGSGRLVNSAGGEPVTLTVTGKCDFDGVAEGVTLRLENGANLGTYGGGVPREGLLYRLDASRPETMTASEEGFVTNWTSRGGAGAAMKFAKVNNVTNGPVWEAACAAFGGRPGMRFEKGMQLRAAGDTPTRTVFMVIKPDVAVNFEVPWQSPAAGYLRTHVPGGNTGHAISLAAWTRFGDLVSVDGNAVEWGRYYGIPGESSKAYDQYATPAGAFIYAAQIGEDRVLGAGGDVLNGGTGAAGGGKFYLAEIIAYGRGLDYDEFRGVEAYLKRKWFGDGGAVVDESDAVKIAGKVELVVGADGKVKPVTAEGTLDAGEGSLHVVNSKAGEKNLLQELVKAEGVASGFGELTADWDGFDVKYDAAGKRYTGRRRVRGLVLILK